MEKVGIASKVKNIDGCYLRRYSPEEGGGNKAPNLAGMKGTAAAGGLNPSSSPIRKEGTPLKVRWFADGGCRFNGQPTVPEKKEGSENPNSLTGENGNAEQQVQISTTHQVMNQSSSHSGLQVGNGFDSSNLMGTPFSTHSCLKKTVTLQDWWLIKPEADDDDDTKALGVAGITCNSQQNRTAPTRCFTSAPISKVFDIFELQTVDNVSIILQGFINKDRTLQNGFPPQVFKHFVFGFPAYWEEFSATCPKRGSIILQDNLTETSGHEDGKDSVVEEHDIFHDSDVDPEMTDCQHTSDKTRTAPSLEHIVNTRDEVLCEKTPVTLEFEDDPRLVINPMSIDVDGIKHKVVKKTPDSSKCLVGSSRRMTRSMRNMDISKNTSLLSHDIFSLDKVTLVDPVNLGNTDILRKDKSDDLSNNKAVDFDALSQSMKNIPKVSGGSGKESNKSASCSDDKVRSKRKPNYQNVDVTEEVTRNKLTSQVSQKKNNEDTDDLQIDKGVKRSKSVCSESGTPGMGCKQVIASTENFNFVSSVPDVNDDPAKATMKACQNKKKHIKEEIPSAHTTDSKKAIMTRSRSKSKVTPQREMPKRKPLITTPKSTSRAIKATKDLYSSPNLVSPEDFSGKRSRSGRVLLPTLEFWRNQKVVYDKDHQVYGIQEPL